MNFRDFIRTNKIMLFDGAMGTELAKRGLEMSGTNNLTHPEAVLDVHREYVKAGADVLITNTLTMNRISLESHDDSIDLRAVNLAGAKLAKQAATGGQFVLGDISSTGQLLEPYGSYTEDQFYETYKEQAGILAEGGVDGFIVETMIDLREALCAVRACRDVADIPVILSLSFSTLANGGRTVMGNTVEEIGRAVKEYRVDAVGSNCGELDPEEMAEIAAKFKQAMADNDMSLPIIIQPNAGKPVLEDDQTRFTMSPVVFAAGIQKCIKAGATMVGGCCGTSPGHIGEVARAVKRNPCIL